MTMENYFYSDYACTMISCWPLEAATLVHRFALQTPDAKKRETLLPAIVTDNQIDEAIEDSYDLVVHFLNLMANWQKNLNDIDSKRGEIFADLNLLANTIKRARDKKGSVIPELPVAELESLFKQMNAQQPTTNNLLVRLATWRKRELYPLMEKWQNHWLDHRQKFATNLISELKEKCNIELSDIERSGLTNPMRSRTELLTDLKKFYANGFPKGYSETSSLFKLRALWSLGAYSKRTMGNATLTPEVQAVLDAVVKSEEEKDKEDRGRQDTDLRPTEEKLNQIRSELDQLAALSPKQRTEVMATKEVPAPESKPTAIEKPAA